MPQKIQRNEVLNIDQARSGLLPSAPPVVMVERDGPGTYEYMADGDRQLDRLYKLFDGFYGAQNFWTLYHSLPEIFAPIHEIASRVAACVWTMKRSYNDEPIYTDKKFNSLFSSPNPYMNMQQMIEQAVAYYLVTGRVFFAMNKSDILGQDYNGILSWYVLPSPEVRAVMRKVDPYTATEIADYAERFEVPSHLAGRTRVFKPDQVMHLVNYSMRKPYDLNCADSFLLGAEKAIKNLIPVYEARGMIYLKRGAMGLLVSKKSDGNGTVTLTKPERDALEREYTRSYGLASNQSTVAITSLPVDYIQTGMSIQELQPFDETTQDAMAIYTVLRVPRHLVPTKDASTFANGDTDMKSFYSDVIIPLAEKFASMFTIGMGMVPIRKNVTCDFSKVDVLQENKKEKAEVEGIITTTVKLQYEANMITKNQQLAMLNYPKVPDGDKFANDGTNPDTIASRIGVGGVTALIAVLSNAGINAEAKKNTLITVFGIPEADAAKMVIEPEKPEVVAVPGAPVDEPKPLNL